MRRALLIEEVEALGGWQIVYADPCWRYVQKGRGAAENHYSVMTAEEIQALPVARLAAKNSVLFLWGTWPQLPVVLDTMRAWGFEFKTCAFVWVKYHDPSGKRCVGGGQWTRANTEFCLLGVRGTPPRRVDKAIRQLIETDEDDKILIETDVLLAPRQEHSAKPIEVRQRIFQLMGDLTAIELFARCAPGGRIADGWDQWGKECDSDIEMISSEATGNEKATGSENPNLKNERNQNQNQGESQMANLPKEYADQAGKARVAGGGNYIQHGDFIFMIDKWFYQKIQDACIICELFVVEARKKIVYEGQKAVEQEPNQVGSTCSDTANFDGASKLSAPANSRAPVLGLFGFKENDVADSKVSETLSYVCSDAQPARGMLIACSTYPKEIRSNKGNYITGRNYECVSKPGEGVNTPEMVKARLEALAKSPEECVKVALAQLAQVGRGAASTAVPRVPVLPGAAPALPTVPAVPAAPVAPSVPWYVTDGWQPHPGDKRYFFKGSEVKLETELQAKQ